MLQFENVDEMLRGGLLGGTHFGQLERAAQVGPRASAVDERTHADGGIDIALGRGFSYRAPGSLRQALGGNIRQQRRGAGELHEVAAVEQFGGSHKVSSILNRAC